MHGCIGVFLLYIHVNYNCYKNITKKGLPFLKRCCIIVEVVNQAPVAQLDRARASDARCRKFESCQVHFLYAKLSKEALWEALTGKIFL